MDVSSGYKYMKDRHIKREREREGKREEVSPKEKQQKERMNATLIPENSMINYSVFFCVPPL